MKVATNNFRTRLLYKPVNKLVVIFILVLCGLLIGACEPIEVIEVTRVVTETIIVEGEEEIVEVTRIIEVTNPIDPEIVEEVIEITRIIEIPIEVTRIVEIPIEVTRVNQPFGTNTGTERSSNIDTSSTVFREQIAQNSALIIVALIGGVATVLAAYVKGRGK